MKKRQRMWVKRNKKTKEILYEYVCIGGQGNVAIAGTKTRRGLLTLLGGHVLKPVQSGEEIAKIII